MLPWGSQPMSVGRQNSYFCAVRFGGCGAAGKTPRTARGLLPSTINTLPSGLNLVTMFEPSSTVQILSSLSTRTEWANSKPRNPLPISLTNSPLWSNSKSRLLLLRWKTKMWPLELVATATASPRYSPAGSLKKFGAVVNGISGTSWMVALRCANAGASANTERATGGTKTRFIESPVMVAELHMTLYAKGSPRCGNALASSEGTYPGEGTLARDSSGRRRAIGSGNRSGDASVSASAKYPIVVGYFVCRAATRHRNLPS